MELHSRVRCPSGLPTDEKTSPQGICGGCSNYPPSPIAVPYEAIDQLHKPVKRKGSPFLTCSEGFLHDQSLHLLSLCAAFSFLTRASRCIFCQRAQQAFMSYNQARETYTPT